MLTLTFLGVGSAFAKRNLSSSALVEAWQTSPDRQAAPDETLLIDFGPTGPLALYQLMQRPGFEYLNADGKVNFPAIRRIFITHQHGDHIAGLEELAFANLFIFGSNGAGNRPFKAQIIASASILANLWDHSLKGGMGVLNGRYALLQDYFFIHALKPGVPEHDHFTLLKRYHCRPFQTDHIRVERRFDWPSYGLVFEDARSHHSAFFSGDTRFDYTSYASMMDKAQICFHEVQLVDAPEPVHTLYSELLTLPERIRRKTLLYHYSDDFDSGPFDDVNEHFMGFAEPFKRYTLLD